MKIICGLGNPGARYAHNRHNMGFIVLDRLIKVKGLRFKRSLTLKAHIASFPERDTLLIKPYTFMNNSGIAARRARERYHAAGCDILIIYDDISLPFGAMRFRETGSSGGHKGMTSVLEYLGTSAISRLRIGIGAPEGDDAASYVLSDFLPGQSEKLKAIVEKAVAGCIDWVIHGTKYVMNKYNTQGD
ncbi:MAG: aminoacyl-tRNA hydrolase [Candidatus Omnitrophica bacterium]|nr:aminoacyl-tRNA hydrolase [Candidatus Omnitrophota bacterium]